MRKEVALHPQVGDASRLLERVGAPPDLVLKAGGTELDSLWDRCERPDWLIWLALIERLPLVAILDATLACFATGEGDDPEPVVEVLSAVRRLDSQFRLREAAEACEGLGGSREAAGYRAAETPSSIWRIRAAADLARAADALLAMETRRWAERDHEATGRATAVGVPSHILPRGDFSPLAFDADDELAWGCIYSLESAMEALMRSRATREEEPAAIEAAAAALADDAFEVLDPVRDGLKRGMTSEALVRPVRLPKERQIDREPKRSGMASVAAIVLPIGGGHHYAGHHLSGAVFGLGIVGSLLSGLPLSAAMIVAADALFAGAAARRRDQGRTWTRARQLGFALAVVALCLLPFVLLG